MAMGRRAKQRRQQPEFWVAHHELPRTVAHPFYQRLNQVLEERGFDEFVEGQCERFYAEEMGRPSLTPGRYFRLLPIRYFEGLDGERGIAWRAADHSAAKGMKVRCKGHRRHAAQSSMPDTLLTFLQL